MNRLPEDVALEVGFILKNSGVTAPQPETLNYVLKHVRNSLLADTLSWYKFMLGVC